VIVPSPVGNLEDMTLRAVRVLKGADLILAEDTRTTARLLQHFGIDTRMVSHHQHNEHKILGTLIQRLLPGKRWPL
jgi:16S rRNA (cytidine1402-2'-O)-methyltransferase